MNFEEGIIPRSNDSSCAENLQLLMHSHLNFDTKERKWWVRCSERDASPFWKCILWAAKEAKMGYR
jgi:hypothetical protein